MSQDAQPLLMQAHAFMQTGQLQDAYGIYQSILQADPNQPEAIYSTGILARQARRFDIAERMMRFALKLRPAYDEARSCLADLLHEQHRYEEAEAEYRRILDTQPANLTALINLGIILRVMERYDEAVIVFRRSVKIMPTLAQGWDFLANTLVVLGRIEEARAAMEEAVRLWPDFPELHRNLSIIKTYRHDDPQIAQVEALLAREFPAQARRDVYYTLGKIYDDLERYDEAFACHMKGNRLQRDMQPYSTQESRQELAEFQQQYQALLTGTDLTIGSMDDTPIFILGMPRSGTTLAAQILCSHTGVHSAGETQYMNDTAGAHPISLEAEDRHIMAEYYLKRLRKNAPKGTRHVIDKLPYNFKHIGLIALIFPNARIIHCTRDPLDTCVSIFRTHGMVPRPYGCDLKELGEYYSLYRDMMAFWHKLLPGRIYDLSYEALVDNLEGETQRLLKHCNLSWEDKCLQFHKTKRNVRTASSVQVRSPLYRSSVGLWKHYEAHLDPLKEALDWHSPAPLIFGNVA